ncbi:zeta toxin family protein [Roseibacillus persicicus]|uniref:zeta toxin family protein n=1 Tax=Roseibacillus persicicus TaxID=454148 RepID=UPI00398AFD5A
MPTAIIIAGPNGAGKTTFAEEFLPKLIDCDTFINADLLAKGLSPFHPEREAFRAGRLMLQLIGEAVAKQETFSIETTLSSQNYLRHIQHWKEKGYRVLLIFLSLDSPELAVKRVARRVSEGGHSIPEKTIIRRFHRGQTLLPRYCNLADEWYHYNTSKGDYELSKESSH